MPLKANFLFNDRHFQQCYKCTVKYRDCRGGALFRLQHCDSHSNKSLTRLVANLPDSDKILYIYSIWITTEEFFIVKVCMNLILHITL